MITTEEHGSYKFARITIHLDCVAYIIVSLVRLKVDNTTTYLARAHRLLTFWDVNS